ncbi:hypothetical protein [Cohnella cholangitidis]|uniref:Uncharacterized protein n=1 Tax=Cohnella cholangitidis TaxID=2598458 RepID=A0A7G5BXX5_9BACL|nr:hypothetical protein [Cohnella cholangitidis]QMV41809.1 hypothetical protein FPL14_11910 [Cohnella cholangitidis]
MNNGIKLPWNRQLCFYLVGLFIVSGPLMHGLFFETEYLLAGIVAFAALGLFAYKEFPSRDPMLYLLLAYSGVYLCSIVYAVNMHDAVLEAVKALLMIPLYLALKQLIEKHFGWIDHLLLGSVFVAVIIGIFAGQFYEGRLTGLVDYANAFAILLLVSIIISQVQYVIKPNRIYLVYHLASVTALCLTQSRTAFLLWIGSQIVLYVFVGRKRHEAWIRALSCSCLGLIGAIAYEQSVWLFLVAWVLSGLYLWIGVRASGRTLTIVICAIGVAAVAAVSALLSTGFLSRWLMVGISVSELAVSACVL